MYSNDTIKTKIRQKLKYNAISDLMYKTWIERLSFNENENGRLEVLIPCTEQDLPFMVSYIQHKYQQLFKLIFLEDGREIEISFTPVLQKEEKNLPIERSSNVSKELKELHCSMSEFRYKLTMYAVLLELMGIDTVPFHMLNAYKENIDFIDAIHTTAEKLQNDIDQSLLQQLESLFASHSKQAYKLIEKVVFSGIPTIMADVAFGQEYVNQTEMFELRYLIEKAATRKPVRGYLASVDSIEVS